MRDLQRLSTRQTLDLGYPAHQSDCRRKPYSSWTGILKATADIVALRVSRQSALRDGGKCTCVHVIGSAVQRPRGVAFPSRGLHFPVAREVKPPGRSSPAGANHH